jgi:dihydrofolate reductase
LRKIILYVAISLDGYIAKKNGDVDWLKQFENTDEDYGYPEFYDSCDTTIMGNKTYTQVLSFGDFPYKEKKNYVITTKKKTKDSKFVEYVNPPIINYVRKIKKQTGKNIWLIGGAQVIELLHNNDLIDEYIISIVPVSLGNGISLFTENTIQSNYLLISHSIYQSGVVRLAYRKRENQNSE